MRIAIDNLPSATMVPNEFIDRIMPAANGEYVKVFLYLLRHNGEEITPAHIADALELTEGDVRRALMRWQREGLISVPQESGEAVQAAPETPVPAMQEVTESISETEDIVPAAGPARAEQIPAAAPARAEQIPAAAPVRAEQIPAAAPAPAQTAAPVRTAQTPAPAAQTAQGYPAPAAAASAAAASAAGELPPRKPADFGKLRKDEDFTTLLYVLQRYLGIIFSQTNTERVAYLYDTLGMSQDLLIYTAEICAERKQRAESEGRRAGDRDWFRYFEKTALRFHSKGIRTAEQAREDDTRYRAAIFAVMNAFGKDCSYPGQAERTLIEKWYNDYGFSAEIIGEACSIVKLSTGGISYSYADKILNSWHEAGIRTVDQAKDYEVRRKEGGGAENGQNGRRTGAPRNNPGRVVTRFHNLEERDDDLEAYALQKMKRELEEA